MSSRCSRLRVLGQSPVDAWFVLATYRMISTICTRVRACTEIMYGRQDGGRRRVSVGMTAFKRHWMERRNKTHTQKTPCSTFASAGAYTPAIDIGRPLDRVSSVARLGWITAIACDLFCRLVVHWVIIGRILGHCVVILTVMSSSHAQTPAPKTATLGARGARSRDKVPNGAARDRSGILRGDRIRARCYASNTWGIIGEWRDQRNVVPAWNLECGPGMDPCIIRQQNKSTLDQMKHQ
jgi:hypothetical protein